MGIKVDRNRIVYALFAAAGVLLAVLAMVKPGSVLPWPQVIAVATAVATAVLFWPSPGQRRRRNPGQRRRRRRGYRGHRAAPNPPTSWPPQPPPLEDNPERERLYRLINLGQEIRRHWNRDRGGDQP